MVGLLSVHPVNLPVWANVVLIVVFLAIAVVFFVRARKDSRRKKAARMEANRARVSTVPSRGSRPSMPRSAQRQGAARPPVRGVKNADSNGARRSGPAGSPRNAASAPTPRRMKP